jgi:hypothetical protein
MNICLIGGSTSGIFDLCCGEGPWETVQQCVPVRPATRFRFLLPWLRRLRCLSRCRAISEHFSDFLVAREFFC